MLIAMEQRCSASQNLSLIIYRVQKFITVVREALLWTLSGTDWSKLPNLLCFCEIHFNIIPPCRTLHTSCPSFNQNNNTGLLEMTVRVLTTCHTQHTADSSICVFLFNRTTLQVFVTYLTGALYVHRLWFYRHQHDNRVRSKLSVACQRWWFEWRFWFVPSVPGYLWEEEEHKLLDPSVQLHTAIASLLCMTSC